MTLFQALGLLLCAAAWGFELWQGRQLRLMSAHVDKMRALCDVQMITLATIYKTLAERYPDDAEVQRAAKTFSFVLSQH